MSETKTVSFYDPVTGQFTGRKFTGAAHLVDLNTPEGLAAMEGDHDHMSVRLDNGQVVDWIPDPPDADHVWDRDRKRWQQKPEAAAAAAAVSATLGQIAMIERSQLRAMRELALDPDHPVAREKLRLADKEIATLRASIKT